MTSLPKKRIINISKYSKKLTNNQFILKMSYIRKSFETKPQPNFLEEDRNMAYTTSYSQKHDYQRPRYASNEKKYDYQQDFVDQREGRDWETRDSREAREGREARDSRDGREARDGRDNFDIREGREGRTRAPSMGEFSKYKYERERDKFENCFGTLDEPVSQHKLKKIAKNYAVGIGGGNFGQSPAQIPLKPQPQNIRNPSSNPDPWNQKKENMSNNKNPRPESQGMAQKCQSQTRPIITTNNHSSYNSKRDDEYVKDSFQRVNEQKILQKIGRINKLNCEINDRLQRILAKVLPD